MPTAVRMGAMLLGLVVAGPLGLGACTALFSFTPGDDGGALARDSGDPDRDASTDGAADAADADADADAGACGAPAATRFVMSAAAVARFGEYVLVGSERGLDRWSGPALGTYCENRQLDGGSVRSIWVNNQGATHVAMTDGLMNNLAHLDASVPCNDEDGPSSTAFGGLGDYHETFRDEDLYVAAGAAGVRRYSNPVGLPQLVHTYVPDPPATVQAITATHDWLFAAAPAEGSVVAIQRSNGQVSAKRTGREPNDLDSTSGRLFIADGLLGLQIVSADADLEPLAEAPTPPSARRIAVDQGFAFICGGNDAAMSFLVAFDVTSLQPVELYRVLGLAGPCSGIAVDDTSVFLANVTALEVVPRGCAAPTS